MRILFATFWFMPDVGGVHTYLQELKHQLEQRGHQVDILAHHPSMKKIHMLGGQVYDKKYFMDSVYDDVYRFYDQTMPHVVPPIRWSEIERYVFELISLQFDLEQYDLIHTQDIFSTIAISRVKPASVPHVATLHGLVAYEQILSGQLTTKSGIEWEYASALEYLGATSADETIVLTNWLKKELSTQFRVSNQPLHVIPHGLNIDKLLAAAQKNPNSPIPQLNQHFTILCPARLAHVKGHPTLIQALGLLKKQTSNFTCLLVGDGLLRAELEQLCAQHQVKEHVYFLGERDDVPSLMKRADCIVLPSLQENHPFVVMEGQTLGKTVVASNVGGIPEMIEHGKTGLLFEKSNSGQLAYHLLQLMKQPDLMKKIGQQSQAWAYKSWSSERLYVQTLKIYEQAISKAAKNKKQPLERKQHDPSTLFSIPIRHLLHDPVWIKARKNSPAEYKIPDQRIIHMLKSSQNKLFPEKTGQTNLITKTSRQNVSGTMTKPGLASDSVLGPGLESPTRPEIAPTSGTGPGTGPYTGPGTAPGTGPGTGPYTGLGTAPGTGPGTGPYTGPGTAPGTGPGTTLLSGIK